MSIRADASPPARGPSRSEAPHSTRATFVQRLAQTFAPLSCIAAVSLLGFLPNHGGLLAGVALAAWVASLASRSAPSILFSLVTLLWIGAGWVLRAWWPLPLVITVGGTALGLWVSPRLRQASPWATWGHADRTTRHIAVAFIVASAMALLVWRFTSGYDMNRYAAFVPALDVPRWVYFVGLWPYAMLNAAAEEVLFRGVMWEVLATRDGRPLRPLLVQSLCFGFAHYAGFPGGWIGVGLAAVYGGMMGYLRHRSGGIGVPFAAHILADVVIYSLIVAMVFE